MREKLEDLLYWLLDIKNNIWHPLKWAWQRLARGWDDRVIWGLCDYLAEMMPIWLRELDKGQHGIPAVVFRPDGWADWEKSAEEWEIILQDMIAGFEAAKQISDLDFPIYEELRQLQRERYGRLLLIWNEEDLALIDEIDAEIDFRARHQAQEDEAVERFRKGMALFTEHFFSLWD